MSRAQPRSLSLTKKLVFAALPALFLLAAAETALRLTGAAERCPTHKNSILWVCDPILYFKANPGQVIHGRPLNRAGFRSREFTPRKPGVYRILSLGDSCTFGVISPGPGTPLEYVREPYPQVLDRIIAERHGEGVAEVMNAGVPGYNSYLGLMLLRTKLRGLDPDLITVRFGWNDLFMSPVGASARAYREPATVVGRAVEDLLLDTALYGFAKRMGMELRVRLAAASQTPNTALPSQWRPDIPVARYKHNLRRIAEVARAQSSKVWFLTAPHAFLTNEHKGHYDRFAAAATGRRLLEFNRLPSFERLIEILGDYNAATRAAGDELGVPVIDMEAVYRQHASEHLFAFADVLHPTQEGHNLEAETLYEKLRPALSRD